MTMPTRVPASERHAARQSHDVALACDETTRDRNLDMATPEPVNEQSKQENNNVDDTQEATPSKPRGRAEGVARSRKGGLKRVSSRPARFKDFMTY